MIEFLELGDFKSIRELRIQLAPFTILVGPNGSGKTSILESIALMAQVTKGNGLVSQSLKGELVDFESEQTIVSRGATSGVLSFGFSTSVSIDPLLLALESDLSVHREVVGPTGKRPSGLQIWLSEMRETLKGHGGGSRKSESRREVLLGATGKTKSHYRFAKSVRDNYIFHRYDITGKFAQYEKKGSSLKTSIGTVVKGKDAPVEEAKTTQNERIAPHLSVFNAGGRGDEIFMPAFGDLNLFTTLRNQLSERLRDVYYLSAQRGHIPWELDTSDKGEATWVGTRGERTLEILSQLMKPENEEKWSPYRALLEKFGVKNGWSGWQRRSVLYSNYIDPYLGSSHKMPSLGFGSKQLIPVVAQLAYSNPESIVLVEEPEISLHPAHQSLLPVLFAKAVQEGKQVIVTTHSSYLPLSLYQVFEGFAFEAGAGGKKRRFHVQLSVDDVAVYHVQRDRNGYTKVQQLELDKEGLKHGIPSFIEVEKKILGKYLGRE
jgi:energy-coupling factor transporter ATP-binding protein EcfA2